MFDLFNQQDESHLDLSQISSNSKAKKVPAAHTTKQNLKDVWQRGVFNIAIFKSKCEEVVAPYKKNIGKPFRVGANTYICTDVLPLTSHKGAQMELSVCFRCQNGKIYTEDEIKFI